MISWAFDTSTGTYEFMLDADLIAPLLDDVEPLVEEVRSALFVSLFNNG